ncbi:MAG: DUF3108 domain-containing protein [Candidatus Omnitrophota bacterium]|jgi:hypothetical protein
MMKIKNILIALVIAPLIFMGSDSLKAKVDINGYSGESIQYLIKPVGRSEYKNLGMVDFKGVKADLVTLKSKILFVEVMENIFYDPESLLPYRTERTNSGLWFNEYRTEEYDQKQFTVVIRKFKNKKLVKEQVIKADGPIQNMNTLLFYLRKQPELKIGWHYAAKVVGELKLLKFDLKLISIDEIVVPGGKFQAYHFISVPDTFEIWIDKNSPRIPLRINIKGIVNCSILMKGYKLQSN